MRPLPAALGEQPGRVRHGVLCRLGRVQPVSCKPCLPTGVDGCVRVWDAADGRCVAVLAHHSEPVTSAAWLPDGRSLVTAGHDKQLVGGRRLAGRAGCFALLLLCFPLQAKALRTRGHVGAGMHAASAGARTGPRACPHWLDQTLPCPAVHRLPPACHFPLLSLQCLVEVEGRVLRRWPSNWVQDLAVAKQGRYVLVRPCGVLACLLACALRLGAQAGQCTSAYTFPEVEGAGESMQHGPRLWTPSSLPPPPAASAWERDACAWLGT